MAWSDEARKAAAEARKRKAAYNKLSDFNKEQALRKMAAKLRESRASSFEAFRAKASSKSFDQLLNETTPKWNKGRTIKSRLGPAIGYSNSTYVHPTKKK